MDNGDGDVGEINYFHIRTLVSHEVDQLLEEIIDLILRDYFFEWANDLLPNTQQFQAEIQIKLKNELWIVLRRIITRLERIDTTVFFTSIVARHLQDHFKKFNLNTTEQIEENQRIVIFNVWRHLEDERAELEYLRKICEFLLKILLPYEYATCTEFIHLLREVLTCHVLYPLINSLCDPFFLNHQAIIAGSIISGAPSTANSTSDSSPVTSTSSTPSIIVTGTSSTEGRGPTNNAFNHNNSSSKPTFHKAKVKLKEYKQKMMCEIFELKGGQHWLRRTVVMFFHLVFDKTINKQVRDYLSGVFSENSMARYLVKFRDTFWPHGKLADASPEASDDDRKLTYLLAKQHLINNIPDVFVSILGQKNARLGFIKVFEALQCKKANKQLFYDVLESFLYEFAPELKA